MNIKEVKWASTHDWFIKSYKDLNGRYGVVVKDDMEAGNTICFESFAHLQDWAGY